MTTLNISLILLVNNHNYFYSRPTRSPRTQRFVHSSKLINSTRRPMVSIVLMNVIDFQRLSRWYWNARCAGQRRSHWAERTKGVCCWSLLVSQLIDLFTKFPFYLNFGCFCCWWWWWYAIAECRVVQVSFVFIMYTLSSSPPTQAPFEHWCRSFGEICMCFQCSQSHAHLENTEHVGTHKMRILFSLHCVLRRRRYSI